MKHFFMTFDADNASELNDKIFEFTGKYGYQELKRSAPAMACFEGYFKIAVTVKFLEAEQEDGESLHEIPEDIDGYDHSVFDESDDLLEEWFNN
jgi:hypothetical protein